MRKASARLARSGELPALASGSLKIRAAPRSTLERRVTAKQRQATGLV